MVLLFWFSFKWQNMAVSEAGAGAEIMDRGGAEVGAGVGAENK